MTKKSANAMFTTLGSFILCVGSQADYQLETLNNWYPSEGHGQKSRTGEGNMTVRNGK